MSLVNVQAREISIKVVYYGPGLGGKTSSLQYIHRALKPDSRGQLLSLATGSDRTLYFDFLPVKLPKMRGFNIRVQLYTVPGQVHYNSTRKLVLNGCDGVVFVADSQRDRETANIESMENLIENLREQGLTLESVPFVLQYNKRDCADLLSVEELDKELNPEKKAIVFETVAMSGAGIFEALKAITAGVLQDLRRKKLWDGKTVPEPNEPDVPMSGSAVAGGISESIVDFTERHSSQTNIKKPQLSPAPAGSMADLLPASKARDHLLVVEQKIAGGDYAAAIRQVGGYLNEVVQHSAGGHSADENGPAFVALTYRLQPDRYMRMREMLRRVDAGGVSLQDATFALFFLIDLEMSRNAARV